MMYVQIQHRPPTVSNTVLLAQYYNGELPGALAWQLVDHHNPRNYTIAGGQAVCSFPFHSPCLVWNTWLLANNTPDLRLQIVTAQDHAH